MNTIEHNKVSRLFLAASGDVRLTEEELKHQSDCEACQELLEIFSTDIVGPKTHSNVA